jgi:hypothetical protein
MLAVVIANDKAARDVKHEGFSLNTCKVHSEILAKLNGELMQEIIH